MTGQAGSLAAYKDVTLDVVRELPDQKSFRVLTRR